MSDLQHEELFDYHHLSDDVLRSRFPGLWRMRNKRVFTYLDSAATSMKLGASIDAQAEFYRRRDASVHRGIYHASDQATGVYESLRQRMADFFNAPGSGSVIYTRNTTEALNLVAHGLSERLEPGDEILLTQMEHHANLVPWLMLKQHKDIAIRYIPLTDEGELDLSGLHELLNEKTRIVSLTLLSNVLGTINPVRRIADAAHEVGATVVVDAAQAAGHMPLDFAQSGADLMAFSAHKMYGPYGLGFLLGKPEVLHGLMPLLGGGQMIDRVSFDGVSFADAPLRFEAGTPDPAAVAGMHPVLDLLEDIGLRAIREHERDLVARLLTELDKLGGIRIVGPHDAAARGGLVSFVDERVHPHDIAHMMDSFNIAIRVGNHCTQPLHDLLNTPATMRVSFGLYSSPADIERFVSAYSTIRQML